jgi:hypothetical protein
MNVFRIRDREPKVAIVSYDDPLASSNLEVWGVIFRTTRLVQQSPHEFEVSKISQYIEDRVVVTEDGDRTSGWDVALRDIEAFLRRRDVSTLPLTKKEEFPTRFVTRQELCFQFPKH